MKSEEKFEFILYVANVDVRALNSTDANPITMSASPKILVVFHVFFFKIPSKNRSIIFIFFKKMFIDSNRVLYMRNAYRYMCRVRRSMDDYFFTCRINVYNLLVMLAIGLN